MISRLTLLLTLLITTVASVKAQYPIDYRGEIIANAGSGNFAPYYIASNNFGIMTQ